MIKPSTNAFRSNLSFADAVKSSVLTGANSVPLRDLQRRISVFSRLIFPSNNVHEPPLSKGKEPIGQFIRNGPTSDSGRNLNFGSLAGQPLSRQNPAKNQHPGFCSHCLSEGHRREACRSSIKCFACRRGGHVVLNCPRNSNSRSKERGFTESNSGAESLEQHKTSANAGRMAIGPIEQQSPPVFDSFAAWARSQPSTSMTAPPTVPTVVLWPDSLCPMTCGASSPMVHLSDTALTLGRSTAPRHDSSHSTANTTVRQSNNTSAPQLRKPQFHNLKSPSPPPAQASSQGEAPVMAYQRANPGPFKPRGAHVEDVPNRPMMVRVVAGSRPMRRNEDLAIVTIDPLPGNPLHFPTVEEILREFLEDYRRVNIREVQPCHLGQAFVRFQNEFDRDRFVLESPHPYGDVNITFTRHNQGRNWRRVNFNQECWLMLMGFPNDYWEQEYVDAVMGPFGKAIAWNNDPDHLTRMLVRARVVDLESIPHFVVFSDTVGYEGDSWTIQVEILQHENIGNGPPDEEPVPPPELDQGPPLFDFFGLGQQVLAPIGAHADQEQIDQLQGEELALGQNLEEQQLGDWPEWPEELLADAQWAGPQINLNVAPTIINQDLNEAPLGEDLQEMVIHLAQDQLMQEEVEMVIHNEPKQQQEAVQVVNNVNLNVVVPQLNHLENFLHHEISEDDLMMEAEDDDMENQQQIMADQLGHQVQPEVDLGMEPVFQNNIHLGMIRIFFNSPSLPYPDHSNLPWVASSTFDKRKDAHKSLIEVPTKWLGLFKALLQAPAQRSWAKQLLLLGFPDLLKNEGDWTALISINSKSSFTDSCAYLSEEPVGVKAIEEAIQKQENEEVSPRKKRSRKPRPSTPVVDSAVRRSDRVRASCNGFKGNICKAKNCLGCSSDPPTLSPSTLKKIGTSICQLQPAQVEDQVLFKKKKINPIGKKQKKGKDDKVDKEKKDEDEADKGVDAADNSK